MICVEDFFNNENIDINVTDDYTKVSLIPYNKEVYLDDAEFFLGFIMHNMDELLEALEVDYFVIQISGHNIDGLSETNTNLLFEDSQVYSNF